MRSLAFSVQPDDLLLRMGEYDLATDEEEFPYVEGKVQIVASHPQFDSRTFEYDLALLRFYDPVRFQPNIIPICLPEGDPDFVGSTAYVSGWGRLYEGKSINRRMRPFVLRTIDQKLMHFRHFIVLFLRRRSVTFQDATGLRSGH